MPPAHLGETIQDSKPAAHAGVQVGLKPVSGLKANKAADNSSDLDLTAPGQIERVLASLLTPLEQPAVCFPSQSAAQPPAPVELSAGADLGNTELTYLPQGGGDGPWDWDLIRALANPAESGGNPAVANDARQSLPDPEAGELFESIVLSNSRLRAALMLAREGHASTPTRNAVVIAISNAADWIDAQFSEQFDSTDVATIRALERKHTAACNAVSDAMNNTFNPQRKAEIESDVTDTARKNNLSPADAGALVADAAAQRVLMDGDLGPVTEVAIAAAASAALHAVVHAVAMLEQSGADVQAACARMVHALNQTEGGRLVLSHLAIVLTASLNSSVR